MVMGNSKNLDVFNFAVLLKSQKFDARETVFMVHFVSELSVTHATQNQYTKTELL